MVTSDHHSVPFMLFVIGFLNDTLIYVVFFIPGISRHALLLLVNRHVVFLDGISNLIFAVATGDVRW